MVCKEKKIMKGKKLLLLLAICILALVAIYFVVKAIPDNEDQGKETTTAVTATIPLLTKSGSDVVKIRVINNYGDETYIRNEDTTWSAERDLTAYINDTVLNRMAAYGSEIYGIVKVQESKDNLGLYGLDAPSQTITLTYKDSTEEVFYFGIQNQVTRENYFMIDSAEGVYTVESSLRGYFTFSFQDLIRYVDIDVPTETSELQEMSISYEGGNKWHLIRYDGGSPYDVSGVRAWFLLDLFEHEVAIDTSLLEALQTWFTTVCLDYCEVYTATDEQLKEHGLAAGEEKGHLYYRFTDSASEKATYEDVIEKVWLGNKTEDGEYYYVKPDGRTGIYKMNAEAIDALLVYSEETLLQKYISVVNIDTIKSYSIEMGDVSFEATVSGEGEPDNRKYTHYHNGKALEAKSASSFYSSLISVYAEKGYAAKEKPEGKPVLAITFNRNTENIPVYKVEFYEHSVSYYKVAINGEISYLANARDYKSLVESITNFMASIPYAE